MQHSIHIGDKENSLMKQRVWIVTKEIKKKFYLLNKVSGCIYTFCERFSFVLFQIDRLILISIDSESDK